MGTHDPVTLLQDQSAELDKPTALMLTEALVGSEVLAWERLVARLESIPGISPKLARQIAEQNRTEASVTNALPHLRDTIPSQKAYSSLIEVFGTDKQRDRED